MLTFRAMRLELRNAFNLAHGSSTTRTNLLVRLSAGKDSSEGLGEVPVVPYYGLTPEQMGETLQAVTFKLAPSLNRSSPAIEDVMQSLEEMGEAACPAPIRCGIDLALHDHLGKRLGAPLFEIFGLNPARVPETSFTIAIDAPEIMADRARKAGLPILKIKLGAPTEAEDLAIVRAIRDATSAKLRLDANGGWNRGRAASVIPKLRELDIELIEQPLAREDLEGFAWLRSQVGSAVPIYADESLQSERDLLALREGIDGVVVKLQKSGGLRGARRLIALARALDLKIMLSCMIESSLGVTAASHIGPLVDQVDLDGPLLIANDPFSGIRYEGAAIHLPRAPGIGVESRA